MSEEKIKKRSSLPAYLLTPVLLLLLTGGIFYLLKALLCDSTVFEADNY